MKDEKKETTMVTASDVMNELQKLNAGMMSTPASDAIVDVDELHKLSSTTEEKEAGPHDDRSQKTPSDYKFAEHNHNSVGVTVQLPAVGSPLPTTDQRQPGAYAEQRARYIEGSDTEVIEVASQDFHLGLDAVDNNELAVAQLIADGELPQAEEVTDGAKRRAHKAKEFKNKILLGAMLAIVIFVIVIAFTVSFKEEPTVQATPSSNLTPVPATMAPISYAQAIRDSVLSLFPPETVKATEDPTSPQSKALEWLLGDKHLPHMSDKRIKQRFALATFYLATNGQEWQYNQNWLKYSVHECEWYNSQEFGFKTPFSRIFPGYLSEYPPPSLSTTTCNNITGQYENLWLTNNNLIGSLPLELYWLTSLKTISLPLSELQGSISSHVGRLTNLQGLVMVKQAKQHENETFGPIPSEIGLLTSMSTLVSYGYYHEGSIPTELWQLTKLSTMFLYRNLNPTVLAAPIPTEIGTFQTLRWLVVDSYLSDAIPTELGQLDALEWLALRRASLTGTVPSEIGQLSKLSLLALNGNQLEGSLPSELGLLTASTLITVRDNHFSGSIPSELGLLTNLSVTLNLRNNQLLSGTIPTELGLCIGLNELSISGNQLTGSIPSEFGQLTMVGLLSLANNSLSGTVPQELSVLHQSLHSLHLGGNSMLSGIIPKALCFINGTCGSTVWDTCEPPFGLSFDCTRSLCGCGCPC